MKAPGFREDARIRGHDRWRAKNDGLSRVAKDIYATDKTRWLKEAT